MKEFITENLNAIIAIAGVLIASFGVIVPSFKKAKKEILEVISEYKKAMSDGKIDEKEAQKLIKELGEALESSTKLWYLVVGVFKEKKNKKG